MSKPGGSLSDLLKAEKPRRSRSRAGGDTETVGTMDTIEKKKAGEGTARKSRRGGKRHGGGSKKRTDHHHSSSGDLPLEDDFDEPATPDPLSLDIGLRKVPSLRQQQEPAPRRSNQAQPGKKKGGGFSLEEKLSKVSLKEKDFGRGPADDDTFCGMGTVDSSMDPNVKNMGRPDSAKPKPVRRQVAPPPRGLGGATANPFSGNPFLGRDDDDDSEDEEDLFAGNNGNNPFRMPHLR